jgi:hypothetical protein
MLLNTLLNDDVATERVAGSSVLIIRQSYAMAIVRLVNGLVDPLQQGIYARPISAIAAQIGLPIWLVELRHSATHEDLPSVEVLREATNQASYSMRSLIFFSDRPIVSRLAIPQLLESNDLIFPTIRFAPSASTAPRTSAKGIQIFTQTIGARRVTEDSTQV